MPGKDNFITKLILPYAQRRAEIEEVVRELNQGIYEKIYYTAESTRNSFNKKLCSVEDTVNEMQWILSTNADVRKARLIRYVPVRIYLDAEEYPTSEREAFGKRSEKGTRRAPSEGKEPTPPIEVAMTRILDALGENEFYLATEMPIEYGSIIKRFWVKTKDKATQFDVENKLAASLEIQHIDKPQAEASKLMAEGMSSVLDSVKDVPNVTIQVGNIFIAKRTLSDGTCHVAAKTLSPMQLKKLEENRILLEDPQLALEFLKKANSSE